jgi:4-amino-4-deoxy-L-arabinose transferase-like glycosyltransferase
MMFSAKVARRSILLVIILLIATFLRLYRFDSAPPGLWVDEAMNGNNAVQAIETHHYQVFYPENHGREGLYMNLIALCYRIHPVNEPWIIRLPAAIAGILTVLGLYLLAAELFDAETGLLSAFLLSTSVWHIIFSRIGFRAILAPLFLSWAFWLLLRAFRTNNENKSLASSSIYALVAGLVYGLGFHSYIAYRISVVILVVPLLYFRNIPGFKKKLSIFSVAAAAAISPLAYYFMRHPNEFSDRASDVSILRLPYSLDLDVQLAGRQQLAA